MKKENYYNCIDIISLITMAAGIYFYTKYTEYTLYLIAIISVSALVNLVNAFNLIKYSKLTVEEKELKKTDRYRKILSKNFKYKKI